MHITTLVKKSQTVNRHKSLYRPHPSDVLKRRFKNNLDNAFIPDWVLHFLNERQDVNARLAEQLAAFTNLSPEAWLYYQKKYDDSLAD
ncbi:hypothetical protein [Pseudoalteromonas sp.]|uniref:hypothetical protein n=1 Tax=Pseudoalteromonas sp. TaxID=53249 RepID=UPI002637392B|nr:hypothetical protein [Pseudoalteromonas sp.]MCP4588485.1 hypothetical protein [Pseudoalteromonas sp.]